MRHMFQDTISHTVEINVEEFLDEVSAETIVEYYPINDLLEQMDEKEICEWAELETVMDWLEAKLEEAPMGDPEGFGTQLGRVMTKSQAVEMCKALFKELNS